MRTKKLTPKQTDMLKGALATALMYSAGIGVGLFFLNRKHEAELDKLEKDTAITCLDYAAEHYEKALHRKMCGGDDILSAPQAKPSEPFDESEEFKREIDAMNNYESTVEQWEALKKEVERLKAENEKLMHDVAMRHDRVETELERVRPEMPTE